MSSAPPTIEGVDPAKAFSDRYTRLVALGGAHALLVETLWRAHNAGDDDVDGAGAPMEAAAEALRKTWEAEWKSFQADMIAHIIATGLLGRVSVVKPVTTPPTGETRQ